MKMTDSTRTARHRVRRTVALVAVPAIALSGAALASTALTASAAQAANTVPNVGKLAGPLAKQKIVWESCGDRIQARFPNLQCATIKVPQDWKNAGNGETFDVRISQSKNIDPKNPRYKGTMIGNPGGPGVAGLAMGGALEEWTPDLNPYYNYVGFDPRGTGESSRPTCDYTFTPSDTDPFARVKALGKQCSNNPQVRVINTEQTVYDMDFMRYLLKVPKLDYLGYSYGTWIGTWYSAIFGPNANKVVLDSSVDSTSPSLQPTWDMQPMARDRQFEMHLMNWLARNDETQGLGTDPLAIKTRYYEAARTLTETYGGNLMTLIVWISSGGAFAFSNNQDYPAAADAVRTVIALAEEEQAGSIKSNSNELPSRSAARLDADLAKVAQRKGDEQLKTAIATIRKGIAPLTSATPTMTKMDDATEPVTMTFDNAFNMIRCNDGQWTQGANYWTERYRADAKKYPFSAGWGVFDAIPECAYWRTKTMMPVADKSTFAKTIVIQGELDSQTAWEGGRTAGLKLPNTSFIAIDNEGSHGQFPYNTEAVDRPVIDFFQNGKLPKNISVTQALPLPLESTTYETWGKLDARARHVPLNPSPWTPTESSATMSLKKQSAAIAKSDALSSIDEQMLRETMRQSFGEAGVKVFDQAAEK